ncbi:MAG: MBL fold metallo-hydrolase [Bacteroidales bacterium]|jgi:phosphoribosyl 1,2-cyclic phosphate phosphodiesterase
MKVTFLGTGTSQGVPVVACNCEVCKSADVRDKRLRSSVMLEINGNNFIIDAGMDFRQQMLRENVKKIDAVIITHAHKDHIGGLDDVRGFNYIQRKPIDVFASKEVTKSIKKDFCYAFEDKKFSSLPDINLHTIKNIPFEINDIKFTPIEVLHYRLRIFGYRVGDFTYITDASTISHTEMNKVIGSKCIVLNALRINTHISHYNLEQAIEVLSELKPETAYLTHISHQLGLHEEVEKTLPSFIKLAYDGLKLNLPQFTPVC